MKPRQLIVLVVIMVILITLVMVKKAQVPPEITQEEFTELDINVDDTKVETIEIGKGSGPAMLRMQKEGETWRIPDKWNAPVSRDKVTSALGMLKDLKGELRASSADLFTDFGIGDDKAFFVRMKDAEDKDLLHFLIGTEQPRYSSSFIRLKDRNDVFLVDYNLLLTFGIYETDTSEIKDSFWTDLRMLDFDSAAIKGVRIDRRVDANVRTLELKKVEDAEAERGRWTFVRQGLPFGVDASKVTDFLEELKRLSGTTYHDPVGEGYALDPFYMQVMLDAGEGASTHVLTVGGSAGEGSESRYVRTTYLGPILALSTYSLNILDIDESRFFPANPLAIDTAKLTSVTVHGPSGERSVKAEAFEQEKEVLDTLQGFSVSRLLVSDAEGKKVKAKGGWWIEIVPKEGDSLTLDIGEALDEGAAEYAAQLRNNTLPFAISKDLYDRISELLSKKEPEVAAA